MSIDGHWVVYPFGFLWIMYYYFFTSFVVHICLQFSWCIRSGIAGPDGNSVFNLLRTASLFSKVAASLHIPTIYIWCSNFAPPRQHLSCHSYFILAFLVSVTVNDFWSCGTLDILKWSILSSPLVCKLPEIWDGTLKSPLSTLKSLTWTHCCYIHGLLLFLYAVSISLSTTCQGQCQRLVYYTERDKLWPLPSNKWVGLLEYLENKMLAKKRKFQWQI